MYIFNVPGVCDCVSGMNKLITILEEMAGNTSMLYYNASVMLT